MWLLSRHKRGQQEAKQALWEAQESLERIKKRSDEVHAVTAAQKNLLERNQFVERLNIIMGGNR